jgi:predicted oxidoreductase
VYVKNAEAKTADGPSMWSDGSDFYVESTESREARRMKKQFDLARAKGIMSMAAEFADRQAKA